jgi:flagellin
MSMLDRKLGILADQRGQIGAFQSRLETASRALEASSLNYGRAESAITDADVADTTAQLTSSQILTQAATAVLAQANQAPALALSLLKG